MTAQMFRRIILVSAVVLIGSAMTAQAQNYGSTITIEPLYPYIAQPHYGYPAPQQYAPRAYPYVRSNNAQPAPRRRSKIDPALIEELRHGRREKHAVFNKKTIVRDKPIVVEHQRVVDDPPIVIRRERVVDVPAPKGARRGRAEIPLERGRVIHAEAEVTILGPDRMSIRLFRKRSGGVVDDAKAKSD